MSNRNDSTPLQSESATRAHETDNIGVRDVDKEGANRLNDKSKVPSAKAKAGFTVTDTDLLDAIKGLAIAPVLRKEPSTFVPNAHVMFRVVSEMDDLMIMNKAWTAKEVRWSPILTRIYCSILFYIQTFRSMRSVGLASSEVKQILRDFESEFDYGNIVVPGPLVPFLKALCSSSTPYEEFGPVCPIIPTDIGCTDATGHALREPLCYLLPNLAGLFNALHHMTRTDAAGQVMQWDANFSDPSGPTVIPAHNATNLQLQTSNLAPGTVYPVTWNRRARETFQRSLSRVTGLPTVPPNAGRLSLTDYIGLDNPRWFSEVVGMMVLYSQHFLGSTSLSTISAADGCIGQFLAVGLDNYPDRIAHVTAPPADRIHYYAKIASARLDDTPPAAFYAALTQINWAPPANFGVNNVEIGTSGSTLFGPWWDVTPIRSVSPRYSPVIGIPQVIADKYYQDKAISK